jgi:DMSO/TMAO reductase YedYZ molybdopterin-dependent catalytic subunit
MPNKLTPEQELRRRTRRGFIGLGAGAIVAAGGWKWLNHGDPSSEDIPKPLRSILQVNEKVVRNTLFSHEHLVKTYPASALGDIRVNGLAGMDEDFDPDTWSLSVAGLGGREPLKLDLDDLKSLPRHEEIIDFKCVEGWSTVTQFAGARVSDFTAKFAPGSDKAGYVSMATPGEGYYVGLDMPSALHPQTLLVWEMNGEPLTDEHGAPLRLSIPVKYGIKSIKRIASIGYQQNEPADYWCERGYDFYAGL